MRRIRKFEWFAYESSAIAVFGIVTFLILIVAVIFVWKIFWKTPEVSVRPNPANLMMAEILKEDNVVVRDAGWKKHGIKLRTIFPVIITVQNGRIDIDKYRRDFPDNASATWQSEWELPHAFQYTPITPEEFRKKYVTR